MKKERKNRAGKGILVLILLLAIGFAAVTTILTINGTIKIGPNQDDFAKNLKFTAATLTYSDPTGKTIVDPQIIEEGKKISFNVGNLTTIGETATLNYTITNSSQYDANIEPIACRVYKGTDATGPEVTAAVVTSKTGDYISLTSALDDTQNILAGNGTADGTLTIEMIKSFVGTEKNGDIPASSTASYYVTCDIVANGVDTDAPTTTPAATSTPAEVTE